MLSYALDHSVVAAILDPLNIIVDWYFYIFLTHGHPLFVYEECQISRPKVICVDVCVVKLIRNSN
jgi:hypothetical protein